MKPIVLKKGYSAENKVGGWPVSTHVFEIVRLNGRQYRIDAGRIQGYRSLYVATVAVPDIEARAFIRNIQDESALITEVKEWLEGRK